MEYVCVSSRYLFFNGRKRYTVHYSESLIKWYVFNEQEESNAVFMQPALFPYATVNKVNAERVLMLFLEQENKDQ